MDSTPISLSEAKKLDLRLITYFRPKISKDSFISTVKNIDIGLNGISKIVNCDIQKSVRQYNHFTWIEEQAERINADPGRTAYIIENEKNERAVGAN